MDLQYSRGDCPAAFWKDVPSGAIIHMDRFYGFIDSGGLAGSFTGYPSRNMACDYISIVHYPDSGEIGRTPAELGDKAICVLSGLEYINRLLAISENEAEFHIYGDWLFLLGDLRL